MAKDLSPAGAHFIQNAEGCRLKMYYCAAGRPTIGYGHVLRPGDPKFISQQQANEFFEKDVRWAVEELNRTPGVEVLTQAQFDALVSFIFNVGAGAWRGSTARRDLVEARYQDVPAQLHRWVHDDHGKVILGLKIRRDKEAKLFSEGAYV